MSLLAELIKVITEAVEESRANQPRVPERTMAAPIDEGEPEAEPEAAPVQQRVQAKRADLQRQREVAARTAAAKASAAAAANTAPTSSIPRGNPGAERIARLLRQPQTMRELIVLKEILDRPLALRGGRR